MYAIKDGYQERPRPAYFLDDPRDVTYQPDVYEFARQLALERGATGIVDIGCGWAAKLATVREQQPDWRFVGVDHGQNLEWCRANHGWGEWVWTDLEQAHEIDARGAVIVSADVIEHLCQPEHHLTAIRESGCAAAVFSTPERDLTWGADHNGPPPNPCHVREWNLEEFGALLRDFDLPPDHLGLTRSDDAGTGEKTILAVVSP
jgi:hypothetical protein